MEVSGVIALYKGKRTMVRKGGGSELDLIMGFLAGFFLILWIAPRIRTGKDNPKKTYKDSDYYRITKRPYKEVFSDKGFTGEYELFQSLKKLNPEFRIVPNVYIPNEFGITEIDMVLIHHSGIYIFENKNYQGVIEGSEEKREWTQFLGGQENTFFSPIVQNRGHVIAIMKYLKKQGFTRFIPHYSIIVFPDDTKVNAGIIYNKYTNLTDFKGLPVIMNYLTKGNKILSNSDVDELYELFLERNNVSDKVKEQHMKTVKNAIKRNSK